MENIINYINKIIPLTIKQFLVSISLAPINIIELLLFIFLIFIFTKFINFIKKPLKYFLFKNRDNIFYRYLFYRVNKIILPLKYVINFSLFQYIFSEIFTLNNGSVLDILFFVTDIILILWFFYEIIKYLIYAMLRKRIKTQKDSRRELFNLFLNTTKITFLLFAIVAVLSKLGVNITALITSLGIGGVIIGFSAKDTLVNFFDSIRLISEDAFRQGDWIETRDIEGFVTELGLTSTQIRTFDNAMVTIPNSKIANDYIKNWSKRVIGRRIKFHIPIQYTTNTKEIDRVIYETYDMLHSHPDIVNLNKIPYLIRMKKTFDDGLFNLDDKYGVRRTLLVYLDDIGEYSMNILVYAFSISVNWEEWLRVKQDVIKKIIKIIENSELNLAYPTQEILLQQSK